MNTMGFLTTDLFVLVGLLALLVCAGLSTFVINHNRKVRGMKRRISARLAEWK